MDDKYILKGLETPKQTKEEDEIFTFAVSSLGNNHAASSNLPSYPEIRPPSRVATSDVAPITPVSEVITVAQPEFGGVNYVGNVQTGYIQSLNNGGVVYYQQTPQPAIVTTEGSAYPVSPTTATIIGGTQPYHAASGGVVISTNPMQASPQAVALLPQQVGSLPPLAIPTTAYGTRLGLRHNCCLITLTLIVRWICLTITSTTVEAFNDCDGSTCKYDINASNLHFMLAIAIIELITLIASILFLCAMCCCCRYKQPRRKYFQIISVVVIAVNVIWSIVYFANVPAIMNIFELTSDIKYYTMGKGDGYVVPVILLLLSVLLYYAPPKDHDQILETNERNRG